MSRYRGPKLRVTRKLGNLPGLTQKRSNKLKTPGEHGKKFEEKKSTEYGTRLEEKQKLKFNYGLTEKQLFSYVKEARRRQGVTGLVLLQLLEMRLDTICFNLGFGNTIAQARQLVNHGHITVNGTSIDIPSFQCRINDQISVKNTKTSIDLLKENIKKNQKFELPSYLKFDGEKLEGKVLGYCEREDVLLQLEELKVIEYYSRR
jgi:small subunit ribosomal protein S4|uniref:ribosomal protein S4 n=1 Tax=Tenuicylindrus belgicus TaxID=1398096 RepID=UPI0022386D9A|nr:ribosomal protein S4 [Tenuicylindrus belgicus]UYC31567.1 ribosomal protein S4 [Tenuicylindrus belgicus]